MTASTVKTTSLAFRVVLYFARNPEEELTSSDIAVKWGNGDIKDVAGRLRKYRAGGVLACVESPKIPAKMARNNFKELTWSAGPALLEMLN